MKIEKIFDIAVIGAGHAGVEVAWIANQLGMQVGLFSLPAVSIASMPCNPSIGGVGKGQIVRELDALGGLMGILADRSAIQYRTLNESKGPAVKSTRCQIDKAEYARLAESFLEEAEHIEIVKLKVTNIFKEGELFHITATADQVFMSRTVVVTAGTFLDGKIHVGPATFQGGRNKQEAAPALQNLFSLINFSKKRFKTGTPPRILKETINFTNLEEQFSDETTRCFHYKNENKERYQRQVSCFLTKTNDDTLSIIRTNREKSPLFNGQIAGVGPRYCPSIEDKAFRYPDRNSHHVFLEPEGLELSTIYPNGLSTSLPMEIQERFINSIIGLEDAKISDYGYAVEYDVVDTTLLKNTLEHSEVSNLFFAGQVNGTSGYEEAAAQGVVAGINASLKLLNKGPFVLERSESYIGVLIDDLISKNVDEPYRLFTARAENRMFIREDNVVPRMTKYRKLLGKLEEIDQYQSAFMEEYNILYEVVTNQLYRSTKEIKECFLKKGYGDIFEKVSLLELLRRSSIDPVQVLTTELAENDLSFHPDIIAAVAITIKYEGYISRNFAENIRFDNILKKKIEWRRLIDSKNISNECKQRISRERPETFLQLTKINGIRPATLAYVAGAYC